MDNSIKLKGDALLKKAQARYDLLKAKSQYVAADMQSKYSDALGQAETHIGKMKSLLDNVQDTSEEAWNQMVDQLNSMLENLESMSKDDTDSSDSQEESN